LDHEIATLLEYAVPRRFGSNATLRTAAASGPHLTGKADRRFPVWSGAVCFRNGWKGFLGTPSAIKHEESVPVTIGALARSDEAIARENFTFLERLAPVSGNRRVSGKNIERLAPQPTYPLRTPSFVSAVGRRFRRGNRSGPRPDDFFSSEKRAGFSGESSPSKPAHRFGTSPGGR